MDETIYEVVVADNFEDLHDEYGMAQNFYFNDEEKMFKFIKDMIIEHSKALGVSKVAEDDN